MTVRSTDNVNSSEPQKEGIFARQADKHIEQMRLVTRVVLKANSDEDLEFNLIAVNDDEGMIKHGFRFREEGMTVFDLETMLLPRAQQVVRSCLQQFDFNPNDIETMIKSLQFDGFNDINLNGDSFWVPVEMSMGSTNEYCRTFAQLAQIVCSKLKISMFICRGRRGLVSISLKYSQAELEKDPIVIFIKFLDARGFSSGSAIESF